MAEQTFTRAQVLQFITHQVSNGLPAPEGITFRNDAFDIDLDNAADRAAWEPVFDVNPQRVHEQPHPIDAPPEQFTAWLTSNWTTSWRGWHVNLKGDDPITDDHRRRWVESGRAAQRAEYLAREAASKGES